MLDNTIAHVYNYARNQILKGAITLMKKLLALTLSSTLLAGCVFAGTSCSLVDDTAKTEPAVTEHLNYGAESYKKLQYIDKVLHDRDCFSGENFELTQKWIHFSLTEAGYSANDIEYAEVPITRYVSKDADLSAKFSAAKSVTTDGKTYKKEKWNYIEDESGTYVKATVVSENIVVTKKGKSDKQIVIGMHYDGTGTGDNGSGVALGLTTAEKFHDIETEFTLKFVFFTAEEYGLYGSSAYAESMSEKEVADTLYMINMDSLVCGDYTYLYGGVQDNENKTVNKTEAYDNAMSVAKDLGLSFKSNPWTWGNLAPENYSGEDPDYASPSTGDWSDHAPFVEKGITYLYMEATNWEIPDYTGYGETYMVGMIMNTEKDYLEYIEHYFPDRPLKYLTKFSTLLNGLLKQTEWNY